MGRACDAVAAFNAVAADGGKRGRVSLAERAVSFDAWLLRLCYVPRAALARLQRGAGVAGDAGRVRGAAAGRVGRDYSRRE